MGDKVQQLETKMAALATGMSLKVLRCAKDGNCLYRAIGHFVGKNWGEVRQDLGAWCTDQNMSVFKDFVATAADAYGNRALETTSLATLKKNILSPGEFGCERVCVIASDVYDRPVTVVTSNGHLYSDGENNPGQPITVGYYVMGAGSLRRPGRC
eukprot:m.9382 g.9382  ORF g.9382 m.9382 type:complete len:155 (+) comp5496_c0_seq1:519-983(+)